jgi:hypothetical protein
MGLLMIITFNPPENAGSYYCVNFDEVVVTDLQTELRTGGLSACSALVVKTNNRRMMAHVTAISDEAQLVYVATRYFHLDDSSLKMFLVPGDETLGTGTAISENKIRSAISCLGKAEKLSVLPIYHYYMHSLVLSKSGRVYVDDKIQRPIHASARESLVFKTPRGNGVEALCV